jgi:hypothetical protein
VAIFTCEKVIDSAECGFDKEDPVQPRYMIGSITTYGAYHEYIINLTKKLPPRLSEVFPEIPNKLLSATGMHVKQQLESCKRLEQEAFSTGEEDSSKLF